MLTQCRGPIPAPVHPVARETAQLQRAMRPQLHTSLPAHPPDVRQPSHTQSQLPGCTVTRPLRRERQLRKVRTYHHELLQLQPIERTLVARLLEQKTCQSRLRGSRHAPSHTVNAAVRLRSSDRRPPSTAPRLGLQDTRQAPAASHLCHELLRLQRPLVLKVL